MTEFICEKAASKKKKKNFVYIRTTTKHSAAIKKDDNRKKKCCNVLFNKSKTGNQLRWQKIKQKCLKGTG